MADMYYHENTSSNVLLAIVAIAIIGLLAFGIYWISVDGTRGEPVRVDIPQSTRIDVNVPEAPIPKPPAP